MRRISFAQRFIAYLCCLSLNVPVLAQAHTIGPNGPIPVERAPLPLPAPESKPVPPPVTKPVNTPMPAPVHVPAESETTGKRKKEIYYIHTDHLNTPRAITNGEQKKVWKWGNVDPFGKNAADENPEGRGRFAFNLRFPGQYYDRETGLHYNWHRDYDPGIGRYIKADSIGLRGGINLYSYSLNNPLVYQDKYGKFSFLIGAALIGALYFGATNIKVDYTRNGYPNEGNNTFEAPNNKGKPQHHSTDPAAHLPFPEKTKKDCDKFDAHSCSERQPTFQTCMACCQAQAQIATASIVSLLFIVLKSHFVPGTTCMISCQQTAYPDNPYGSDGL